MTWESKLEAASALKSAHLEMRCPGNWFVSQQVSVKRDIFLEGRYGNGRTPEEAVNDHWEKLTKLAPEEYLVYGYGDDRRAVRWNGFMWESVKEQVKA